MLRTAALLALLASGGCATSPYPSVRESWREAGETEPRMTWMRDVGRGVEIPPLAGPEIVFVASGRELTGLDARSGERRWKAKLPGEVRTFARAAGVLAAGCDDREAKLVVLDPATGKTRWRREGGGPLVAGDGDVLVAGGFGGLIARVDAESGEALWRAPASSGSGDPPVVDAPRGLVFASTGPDSLVAFDAADGREIWRRRVGFRPREVPVDAGLLVAVDDPALVLLDPQTGAVLARAELPGTPAGPPAVNDGTAVAGTTDGAVIAVSLPDLRPRWARRFDPPLVASPAWARSLVVVGTPRGTLLALEGSTGETAFTARHPEKFLVAPIAAGDGIVAAGGAGTVAAYRIGGAP